MAAATSMTPKQQKAKQSLAANSDFDSYTGEYHMGGGWFVIEWLDYQYRAYATEIDADGFVRNTREIWCD